MTPELKQPPHSIDAEQAVLCAIMQKNALIYDLDGVLDPAAFYRREHRVIYDRMAVMSMARKPIEPVALVEELNHMGELEQAGGMEYVIELSSVGGLANVMHYAEVIQTRYLERRLIAIGNEISALGWESMSLPEKIEKAQKAVFDIEIKEADEPKNVNVCLRDAIDEIDRRFRMGGQMIGLPTGFADFDHLTSGLGRGEMIIVAGRPAMGKTTFAMNIAEHVALNNQFVIVFSLEMTSQNLMMRSISSLGKIPFNKVKRGQIGEHPTELTAAATKLKDKTYYVDDNSRLTSGQLVSRARKIANRMGRRPDLIIVDYLQLLTDPGDGHERITRISRNIKLAAKDLDCPVVALSQLNRSLEQRNNKRPLLSDLRESGSLEQDSDIVVMLYRDEVYNEESRDKGVGEAIIRKQRNGELGTVYLAAQLEYCRFADLTKYQPQEEPEPVGGRSFEY